MHDGLSYRMLSVVIIYTGIQARSSVMLLAAFMGLLLSVAVYPAALLLLLLLLSYAYCELRLVKAGS
jgi:hypothetical protein